MIPAADSGIELHVRNRHLEGRDSFPGERLVVFGPGAAFPFRNVFQLWLPGGSWGGPGGRKGYRRFLYRGGRYRPLPAAGGVGAAAGENPPFATTTDAVKDVGS